MRRLTLLAALAVAGCGGGHAQSRDALAARADRICQDAAVPGIPVGAGGLTFSPRQTARMASLAFAQERREVDALRALGWEELEPAVGVFDDALAHLDAFARSQGAAADERGRYDVLLERWRGRAGALGLDVCSRFGFSY